MHSAVAILGTARSSQTWQIRSHVASFMVHAPWILVAMFCARSLPTLQSDERAPYQQHAEMDSLLDYNDTLQVAVSLAFSPNEGHNLH